MLEESLNQESSLNSKESEATRPVDIFAKDYSRHLYQGIEDALAGWEDKINLSYFDVATDEGQNARVFIKRNKNTGNREPHELQLTFSQGNKKRILEAKFDARKGSPGSIRRAKVEKIRDRRSINVGDGISVTNSFRMEDGKAKPGNIHVITPLDSPPFFESDPIQIDFLKNGEEVTGISPNAAVYIPVDLEGNIEWRKTYVYAEGNAIYYPISSDYEDIEGNLLYSVADMEAGKGETTIAEESLARADSISKEPSKEIIRLVEQEIVCDPNNNQTDKKELAKNRYLSLLSEIQSDPNSDKVWLKLVELARSEEGEEKPKNYYQNIPLEELISVGERIRAASSRDKKYAILSEYSSIDEQWYDIILGHVNDKAFEPIIEELSRIKKGKKLKWERGLDIGSGTGNSVNAIAPFFMHVVGVDKLKDVLQSGKRDRAFAANTEVIVGEATQLPFAEKTCDVAVSNGLSHYLSRTEMFAYIKELARVLKPGGIYLESFVEKAEKELLPLIERDYLTSAKALLVCLLDNQISHKEQDQKQDDWNIGDMVNAFKSHGFEVKMSRPNKEGVSFITFTKISLS